MHSQCVIVCALQLVVVEAPAGGVYAWVLLSMHYLCCPWVFHRPPEVGPVPPLEVGSAPPLEVPPLEVGSAPSLEVVGLVPGALVLRCAKLSAGIQWQQVALPLGPVGGPLSWHRWRGAL